MYLNSVQQIVGALKSNLIVCFPTETVYALACSAFSEDALYRLYALKRRPLNKPLSLLLCDIAQISSFSYLNEENWKIVQKLSPGPITFVLPLNYHKGLSKHFFKGTLGVRVPEHAMALAILREFGAPVAATSVNLSGAPSATKAVEIPPEVRRGVASLIEDDFAVMGVCSTVFDVGSRKILRAGMLPDSKIYDTLRSCDKDNANCSRTPRTKESSPDK